MRPVGRKSEAHCAVATVVRRNAASPFAPYGRSPRFDGIQAAIIDVAWREASG